MLLRSVTSTSSRTTAGKSAKSILTPGSITSNRLICIDSTCTTCPIHSFRMQSSSAIKNNNPRNGFSPFGGDLLAHECGVDCPIHKTQKRSKTTSAILPGLPQESIPDLEGTRSGVYDILLRNRAWADSHRKENPDFFRPLSEGQKPKYFVVCCSDSRCPSEKLMGFQPGECFTVRNIANCVMNADIGINAATQFAVDVLGVENILVVGHRDCGGIKAAMTRQSFGTTIDMYVRHVRDVYRQHVDEIDKISDPDAKLNCLIEKHVIEQCINIFKMGFVQRARRKTAPGNKSSKSLPQIHGMVYDPSTGFLQELDIGLRTKAKEYGKVYDVLLQ